MAFRDQACAHLSQYRKNDLGLAEEGIFLHRGKEHRKGHILPTGSEQQNLLERYRDRFYASRHGAAKRHRYFHHLNSSQGLCFNLVFPLIEEGQMPLLVRAIGSDMRLPTDEEFEFESPLEKAERRTSFDFHMRGAEDREIFFEVKYTEDGFGGAKHDAEHLQKFHDTYAPLLNDEYLTPECRNPDFFLKNYQILRNLVHITPKSEVVFLFPRANKKVAEQAENARTTLLRDSGRKRMHVVFLEDLVIKLIEECKETELAGYYEAFYRKYLAFLQ